MFSFICNNYGVDIPNCFHIKTVFLWENHNFTQIDQYLRSFRVLWTAFRPKTVHENCQNGHETVLK